MKTIWYIIFCILLLSNVYATEYNLNSDSNSMYPAINRTSTIWVNETSKVRLNDIIMFNHPDDLCLIKNNQKICYVTVHRIIGIRVNKGKITYLTKGDNNPYDDCKSFFNCEITPKMIIGKVYKIL